MILEALQTAAQYLGAALVVGGVLFGIYRWILKQARQDEEIKALKEEQAIICYGLLAALKGLHEKGCNGPVTDGIQRMEKHLNQQAHK
ncbi:MAG: branched-chain amino acid ABC transporter permease [Clostridia bacterium]|nr:branched-chain amino acid ABC transporter permease [Clostridia bacterium]